MNEKEYKKQGQVIKKLYSGNDGYYLKWKIQLEHVLKIVLVRVARRNLT